MVFLRPTRNPNPFSQPFAPAGSGYTYATAVESIPNLLAYWQLTETSGTNAVDSSGNGYNGTYNGTTLNNTPQAGATMGNAPLFNGTSDFVQLPQVSLNSTFSPNEGTYSVWCKVLNSGVWTDGAIRMALSIGADANNRFMVDKSLTNNTFIFQSNVVAASELSQSVGSQTQTTWFHVGLSWSKTSTNYLCYINGANVGTVATRTHTFAGTLAATFCAIGMQASIRFWSGWLGNAAIYTRALASSEITTLATAF